MNVSVKQKTEQKFFQLQDFELDSGEILQGAVLAYETFGTLNKEKDNAILICHALTGDTHAGNSEKHLGWWYGLIGEDKALDTSKYFLICANVIGGCYGSTGPSSPHPVDGKPYALRFPVVTIRDMVKAQYQLVKSFGIERLFSVIGGSMGGMQVFEWAVSYPEMVKSYIPIASNIRASALGIAWNNVMRQAIMNDPEWCEGEYYGRTFPVNGLNLARRVGMITYRSFELYEQRFGQEINVQTSPYHLSSEYEVERYLSYQGRKFVNRFDANSYLYLIKAMDLHNIANGYGSEMEALKRMTSEGLLIGISSDALFPPQEMSIVAEQLQLIGNPASYYEMESIHGHDAFLIEFDELNQVISEFLARIRIEKDNE